MTLTTLYSIAMLASLSFLNSLEFSFSEAELIFFYIKVVMTSQSIYTRNHNSLLHSLPLSHPETILCNGSRISTVLQKFTEETKHLIDVIFSGYSNNGSQNLFRLHQLCW